MARRGHRISGTTVTDREKDRTPINWRVRCQCGQMFHGPTLDAADLAYCKHSGATPMCVTEGTAPQLTRREPA